MVDFTLKRLKFAGGHKPESARRVFREAADGRIDFPNRVGTAPERRSVMEQSIGSGQPESAAGFHRQLVVLVVGNFLILRPVRPSRLLLEEGICRRNPQNPVTALPGTPDVFHSGGLRRPVQTVEARHDLVPVGGGFSNDGDAAFVTLARFQQVLDLQRFRREIIVPRFFQSRAKGESGRLAQTALAGDPKPAVARHGHAREFSQARLIAPE